MKVLMTPHIDSYTGNHESGIKQVIKHYFKYLPDYGVELVKKDSKDYDLHVAHAGITGGDCSVCSLHGLYWSAEHDTPSWEHSANQNIVNALRSAKQVTVPSEWVAETIRRDMRFNPHVVGHGIDVERWRTRHNDGYVLWNKNRNVDVCDPTPMVRLAEKRKGINFITTFMPAKNGVTPRNIKAVGMTPHNEMKMLIEKSMVYLSTTKETFGIGILEAMAAGVPVLGFDWGGNSELIEHGINGYLAQPGNIDELAYGLDYCTTHRKTLGANGREMAKKYTWQLAVEKVAGVYRLAMEEHPYKGEVSIVIPVYNYGAKVKIAVESALNQTVKPLEVILVNDGSTDDTESVCEELAKAHDKVKYVPKLNGGVATARNKGIENARGEYICCLDADDQLAPKFLEACTKALKEDRSLGLAYTGLMAVREDGKSALSKWPEDCDYDKQMYYRSKDNPRGLNQIPTCCVFKREAWERTGGYKQRYAPLGAGSEDAEFFTRIMSIGYSAKKVTNAGLFIYSLGTGLVSGAKGLSPELIEPRWLTMHPWALDKEHPFASMATPLNDVAHPVRAYDEPIVSFVIPVGPGHEKEVINALDSIESQTYRKWEAIVVWDTEEEPDLKAYPYIRLIKTKGSAGAGYARNRGAEEARGIFLIFLDADDQIAPTFTRKCLNAFSENEGIIYTDYYNSIITDKENLKNYKNDGVVQYVERTKVATIAGRSADYDCERAQRQPSKDLFHWCLVTCLIPKKWHDAIGGFDEKMTSFEDVHYHWMMARSGYCYYKIPEHLVSYKLYTGKRREKASIYTDAGREVAKEMLRYSKNELEKIEMAGCSGCGKRRATATDIRNPVLAKKPKPQTVRQITDTDYVMCLYTHGNIGNHHVIGRSTGKRYGYRKGGTKFLVHVKDIEAQPHLFVQIPHNASEGNDFSNVKQAPKVLVEPKEITEPAPTEPRYEEPIVTEETTPIPVVTDLKTVPGITPVIAKKLEAVGCHTPKDVLDLGVEGLVKIKGIGEQRAEIIIEAFDAMSLT